MLTFGNQKFTLENMISESLRASHKIREAVKLHPSKKQYEIAFEVGIDPATLSRIIGGYERLKPNDPRILKLGTVLGLKKSDLFEK